MGKLSARERSSTGKFESFVSNVSPDRLQSPDRATSLLSYGHHESKSQDKSTVLGSHREFSPILPKKYADFLDAKA